MIESLTGIFDLRSSNRARELVLIVFLRGGAAVLLLGQTVLLSNMFGSTSFGIYAYVTSWALLISVFARCGVDTSGFKFIADYRATGEVALLSGFIRWSNTILGIASIAIVGIAAGIVIFGSIGTEIRIPLLIGALIVPFLAVAYSYAGFLVAMQSIVKSQLYFGVVRPILVSTFALFALYVVSTTDPSSLLLAELVATVIIAAGLFAMFHTRLKAISGNIKREARSREWLLTSVPMLAVSGFQILLAKADVVLVGMYIGVEAAGGYYIASQLAGIVGFFGRSADNVIAPEISRRYAISGNTGLQSYMAKVTFALFVIALPVTLFMLLFGSGLLSLFGDSYEEFFAVLFLLVCSQATIAFFGPVGFLLTMTGSQNIASIVIGLSAALNVGFNILLIPQYGVEGAAVATLLATAFRGGVLVVVAWRRTGVVLTPFSILGLR